MDVLVAPSAERRLGRGVPVRAAALVVLGLGCIGIAFTQTAQVLVDGPGSPDVMTFLWFLSVLPVPALAGFLLAGGRHAGGSPATAGLLLGVASWMLLYVAMVTFAVVPAAICAVGGLLFGGYAILVHRVWMLGWWAVAMNSTLLAAAVYAAVVLVER